jgi:hypothetical protein
MSGDWPFEWGWHAGAYYLLVAGRLGAKVWSEPIADPTCRRWHWRCGPRAGVEQSRIAAQLRAERAWLELSEPFGEDGGPEPGDPE